MLRALEIKRWTPCLLSTMKRFLSERGCLALLQLILLLATSWGWVQSSGGSVGIPSYRKVFKARLYLEGAPPLPFLRIHEVVIVEQVPSGGYISFDFLPVAPTAPETAFMIFSLQNVPGMIREKRLRAIPRDAQLIGLTSSSDEDLRQFASTFNKSLRPFTNDCRTFARAFENEFIIEVCNRTRG